MTPKQQYESALADWQRINRPLGINQLDAICWFDGHAKNLLAIAAARFAPVVTDAMVERAARAVLRRNFPSLSDADIDEMWEDHAGDMKAALTAALQENGQ